MVRGRAAIDSAVVKRSVKKQVKRSVRRTVGRSGAGEPSEYSDASRGERLQRVLADAGVASRRACEEMIEAGRVEVNGRVVSSLPAWVDPKRDRIAVDGRPIARTTRHVYVMLNKPERTLSTARDEPGALRRTVVGMVEHPSGARLFPVGRLDYHTTGLVLLTNDGDLANALTHPRYGVAKTYLATVKGALSDEEIEALERGVYLADRRVGAAARTRPAVIRKVRQDRARTVLEITLHEGRNRQVRRMLAKVGHPVRRLERVAMGPLQLSKLARGEWRELTVGEVRALREAARRAREEASGSNGRAQR